MKKELLGNKITWMIKKLLGKALKGHFSNKYDNNKCQIYEKNKAQIITTVEMASNEILPLNIPLEEKLALCSINDESTL